MIGIGDKMPPKRKAVATKKAPAKKVKVAEDDTGKEAGPSDIKKTVEALKKGDTGKKTHKVDAQCMLGSMGGTVSKYSNHNISWFTCLVPA